MKVLKRRLARGGSSNINEQKGRFKMVHFLMTHWQVALGVVLLLGGGFSLDDTVQDDDDWHAHPMNKDGMNYMHD